MKYVESGIKFLIKYYMLAIPLLILFALPNIAQGTSSINAISGVGNMFSTIQDPGLLKNPIQVLRLISSYLPLFFGGGFFSFILGLLIYPSTYGMINKALETGYSDLNDFIPSLQLHFVRYILYWVGTIVVSFVLTFAAGFVLLILGLLLSILKGLGIVIFVLAIIAIAIIGIIITILLSLWFSSMLIDNFDFIASAKKSIEIAKSSFWTLIGVTLLIKICGSIVAVLLALIFSRIPLIGPIILGAIPAATGFIMIVFYISLYREKTGRIVSVS